ncbi:CsbD family protein [Niveispirillum sp.]|uniref:CsbD family protein n=1 Tax=Niveispirillum sp. TaxID=1917217 RepID=UPI001B6A7FC0|nr:CsbD family protein [Niveispirillum sp.]MBP7340212.1 CsbD family protein [Niveispirillum sp.]
MNTDTIKGKFNEAKGAVKKGIGKATDDPVMEIEGEADKAKGRAQQVKGHLKDAARDLTR